ncbi:MAG: hypothetical protein JEZ00_11425 [Anaerolineaceae bacterium]|nr:hypothetical protein [Anaerolineaceae bacterium]
MIERLNYLKIKKHLKYLEEVLQLNPASVDRYRFYLRHLLLWANDQNFRDVQRIRPTLPTYIASLPGKEGKVSLAVATQKKILNTSKRFFRWAKETYPRDMNNLPVSWIDTLRLPRQPQVSAENVFVTQAEVLQLISIPVPENDMALLRDQAAAAMLFLSGMRASAFATLPISAIDLENLTIFQWPELGVHTKNGKKATTFILNIPELLIPIHKWDAIVRTALPGFSPWYAPIAHTWGDQGLSIEAPGKSRSNALHKRLKLLFSLANVTFKSAHKFRHGHAVYGLLHAQTMADYKAVSMNLMHDSIEITDSTYAPMLSSDVQERIAGLSKKTDPKLNYQASLVGDEMESYLTSLNQDKLKQALVLIAGRFAQ